MVDVASLTVGREFLEDQDNVVSATRIFLEGASANGVKRSEGELTAKVELCESGTGENTVVDAPSSSLSCTTSINLHFCPHFCVV